MLVSAANPEINITHIFTQSRSTDTIFIIAQSFSIQARMARRAKFKPLTALLIGHPIARAPKMIHDKATAALCTTVSKGCQDFSNFVPNLETDQWII
jgi:hypothetical protein